MAASPLISGASLAGLAVETFEEHRREDAAVTRVRLAPRLRRFGITRIANVTGLDRLGIPVFMAIRPNSRSLSVSQGKGIRVDAAWVSAAMEGIELWHAEAPDVPLTIGSAREVAQRRRVVGGEALSPGRQVLWAPATELVSSEPVLVPYGLVHVNAVPPFPPGDECLPVSSNGLASGLESREAAVHAICELVERDAIRHWQLANEEARAARWIDLGSSGEPIVAGLRELCDAAGFDLLACAAESATGLPVVAAVILDRWESPDTLRGASMGFGCHLRRDVAFVRAVTEAAQSRLTLIAGSRDDLERSDYEAHGRHRHGIQAYRDLLGATHPLAFDDLPDHRDVPPEAQLDTLLLLLRAAGFSEIAMLDLSPETEGLSVVRVIAPGLLGPDHGH